MNNQTLIIYAHPTKTGHHGYFLNQLTTTLSDKKISYELLDLYAMNYNPILTAAALSGQFRHQVDAESQALQEKIKAANKLIFIYPTWWQNMPAILKGFIDRTLVAGFAFEYRNRIPVGLLRGKKAAVFTATGGPRLINKFILHDRSLKILTQNVLNFCGIKTKGFSLGSATNLTDAHKEKLKIIASKLISYLY